MGYQLNQQEGMYANKLLMDVFSQLLLFLLSTNLSHSIRSYASKGIRKLILLL